MDSGNELFNSYEQDLQGILSNVANKLQGEAKQGRTEQRKAVLRRLEMDLDEADEAVAQMEIEVQSLDRAVKSKAQVKLRGYKAELSKRHSELKEALSSIDRSDLLGQYRDDPDEDLEANNLSGVQQQRARLLNGTDKLSDSSRRLEESHRIALETEDLGADILGNLRGQREQIEGTRDRLYQADRNIDRASGTLGKMIRRMYQQKIVTGLIIAVLVFLMWVFCYLICGPLIGRVNSLFILYAKFR